MKIDLTPKKSYILYVFQETYGEDPYLSGMIASSFVKGLKGDYPKYYRVNAVCKHFDAYGGPEDLPQSRLSFNAQVNAPLELCREKTCL